MFHNTRLPKFIEIFASGGPEFSTSTAVTISGREVRQADQEFAKQRYFIENARLSYEQFEQFNAFFRARRGQNYSFRLRDHADFKCTKQIISNITADGKFALIKSYRDKIFPYIRKITKPVEHTIQFYVNTNPISEVEVNYDTGIAKLGSPLQIGQVLTADFHFDIEVRFASDSFQYNHNADGTIGLTKIELIEVFS